MEAEDKEKTIPKMFYGNDFYNEQPGIPERKPGTKEQPNPLKIPRPNPERPTVPKRKPEEVPVESEW